MTGIKEGTCEDPFASNEENPDVEEQTAAKTTSTESELPETESPQSARHQRSIQILYKYRRNGVQDGRERVPLFLQSETKSAERDAQRELEDRFDDDVSLTDLREALRKAGLDHLDEVEGHLEEWGYDMTFEE